MNQDKQNRWGLPKCDEDINSLNYWKGNFINCITDNPIENKNDLWEKLDAKQKKERVNQNCCNQIGCSNPEVVIPQGIVCGKKNTPPGPRFGGLRNSKTPKQFTGVY